MLTPLLLPLLLVVGAPAASTVALRSDARPVTQAQAATMPPPALADALLAAGHPPIVATSLPERSGALPPPGYVPPLDVGLVAAATLPLDRIFVVRRYIVTPLLDPAALTAPDGRPREDWEVFASDPHGGRMWSIHLALDGDRIVALRMVHQFPAPF